MAAKYLASKGIDLEAVMARARGGIPDRPEKKPKVVKILGCRLPGRQINERHDVELSHSNRAITVIEPHGPGLPTENLPGVLEANGALLVPALCHPHIHIDKCFLLSDPAYQSSQTIEKGDFAEAMSITNKAKADFTETDLIRRGGRLIRRSISAGVTSMRAFVEVDETVGLRSLQAALKLKDSFKDTCTVQICAFAQLALFSSEHAEERRQLLVKAAQEPLVDVIGSTPYVEDDRTAAMDNVRWTVEQATVYRKHVDFHLDYNLDQSQEPLVWHVLDVLEASREFQSSSKTVCLGHCTRLTLFEEREWTTLARRVKEIPVPISFVGLPTSDLFMMGRPTEDESLCKQRVRGTLPIPQMIEELGLKACLGVNNVGNAFTPQGGCDPLSLASFAVGVYQTATIRDAHVLYECVSSRARIAIGLADSSEAHTRAKDDHTLGLVEGWSGDLLLLASDESPGPRDEDSPLLTVATAVYDPSCISRRII